MPASPFRIDPYGPYAREIALVKARLDQNPQEQLFVSEYLVDLNERRAAQAVGLQPYDGKKLLKRYNVKAAIELATRDRAERLRVTADKVVQEFAKVGFANMGDYLSTTPDGDPYFDYKNLDRDQTAALAEVTIEEYADGRGPNARDIKKLKLKLHDKMGSLNSLGRHLGMFVDRTEIRGEMFMRLANMPRQNRIELMYSLLERVQHLLPPGETIDMEPSEDEASNS